MQEAIVRMLARYESRTLDDATRALREIIQEVALLGLWRAKFFEKAAFYGGTALRILHGLDRYSEDLDFSLLEPSSGFDLGRYTASLQEEVQAFGFDVRVDLIGKAVQTPVQSAFLKANTRNELLVIETPQEIAQKAPRGQVLKVKLEVDTDPPGGFATQTRYLLHPIPFPVRAYTLPDLFAGKMHAVLCRRSRGLAPCPVARKGFLQVRSPTAPAKNRRRHLGGARQGRVVMHGVALRKCESPQLFNPDYS